MNQTDIDRIAKLEKLLANPETQWDTKTCADLRKQIADIKGGQSVVVAAPPKDMLEVAADDGENLKLELVPSLQAEIAKLKVDNAKYMTWLREIKLINRKGYDKFRVIMPEGLTISGYLDHLHNAVFESIREIVEKQAVDTPEVAKNGTQDASIDLDVMDKKQMYDWAKAQDPPIKVAWTISTDEMRATIKATI